MLLMKITHEVRLFQLRQYRFTDPMLPAARRKRKGIKCDIKLNKRDLTRVTGVRARYRTGPGCFHT